MRFDLVTALPDLVRSPLEGSIVGRARKRGIAEVHVHDLREHGLGRYRQVDDLPYGGMGGMVLKPEPIFDCIERLQAERAAAGEAYDEVVYLSPDGETLTQPLANALSLKKNLLLLCGHYKGVDERVREALVTREVSVGDYVLSGGELAACVLVDAVVRFLPGAIGDAQSALSDSFQDGLLDAPAYTRPAEFRGMRVPDVLLSGDHERVLQWREAQRLERTRARRPDLLGGADDPASSREDPS